MSHRVNSTVSVNGVSALIDALVLRPLEIEHLADLRALASVAARAASSRDELAMEAAVAHIHSPVGDPVSESARTLGAWLDGFLVGTIAWRRVTRRGGEVVVIESLVVHPLYWRLGIGRALLQTVEAMAVAEGTPRIAVTTLRSHVGFYSANGYRVSTIGRRRFGSAGSIEVAHCRRQLDVSEAGETAYHDDITPIPLQTLLADLAAPSRPPPATARAGRAPASDRVRRREPVTRTQRPYAVPE